MSEILLNRDGTIVPPEGYTLVATEVDFLRQVSGEKPLLVRGEKLCEWAETFYQSRAVQWQEIYSVKQDLQVVCPDLTNDQAQVLAQRIEEKLPSLHRPLTTQAILQALYPLTIWVEPLSLHHAADWLLWIYQTNPENCIQPLLAQIGNWWYAEANLPERDVYKVCTQKHALHMLDDWLGIGNREDSPIKDIFPLEAPLEFQEKARHIWSRQIIESHGAYFDQLERLQIPFGLKKVAAKEAYQYYIKNPDELITTRLDQLSVYLTQNELSQLRQYLSPSEPSNLPTEPEALLTWFRDSYLPYREWQHYSAALQGKQKVLNAARDFALWYLDNYPKALAGAPLRKWISFSKVNGLSCGENCIVLLVVLDGLHATDARFLLQCIRTHTQRLSVISNDFAFAPLPTVTQFAKEALFRGVPPDKTQEVEPIGDILPEDKSPAYKLANVQRKGLYLWRVLEPDRTYHQKNKSENLRQDVEGRLEAEALKIKEIVDTVPDQLTMQIVITTDHGRMLGKAKRIIHVPEEMQGHSRAVWGASHKSFPEKGYIVEGDLAYLFAESFGLHEDTLISLDESAFRDSDDRTGTEFYPHGGLFPEEVIVPWIVLARDYVRPEIEIVISGNGRARRNGTLEIRVLNQSDVDVILEKLIISYREGVEHRIRPNLAIGARSGLTHKMELDTWPSSSDVKYTSAVAWLRQPNQLLFEYPTQTAIRSEDMYDTGSENILEDLE